METSAEQTAQAEAADEHGHNPRFNLEARQRAVQVLADEVQAFLSTGYATTALGFSKHCEKTPVELDRLVTLCHAGACVRVCTCAR